MTTPFKDVSFTSESVSQHKLQQLANNVRWLFENSPRMRYAANGLTRDSGLKIMAGKVGFPAVNRDHIDAHVYFGNFFSAGCQPVVTCMVQTTGGWLRKFTTIRSHHGLGAPIDHVGFVAHITSYEGNVLDWHHDRIEAPGFLHWQAVGY